MSSGRWVALVFAVCARVHVRAVSTGVCCTCVSFRRVSLTPQPCGKVGDSTPWTHLGTTQRGRTESKAHFCLFQLRETNSPAGRRWIPASRGTVCSEHHSPPRCAVLSIYVSQLERWFVPSMTGDQNENMAADHGELISGLQRPAQHGVSVFLGVGFLKLSDL